MGLQSTHYSCCYLITLSVTHSFFPMLDCMLHESREPWDLVTTIVVVQSLSHVQLFATPWTEACQAPLSFTVSQSLLRFMSIESVMPSNHLILCCPLLLPSVFPSIRVFSNESVLHTRWPKDWSFSFSISLSNEYSGLISFRIDWFDLLAVQGTLKSLLKHHNSKASILWLSAFSMVHLSHPFMTIGKTIALTSWTFVSKMTTEELTKKSVNYSQQILALKYKSLKKV